MRFAIVTLLAAVLAGCSLLPARHPVPSEHVDLAAVPGMPSSARMWGDRAPDDVADRVALVRERAKREKPIAWTLPQHYLALSGGGPFGAFGAGLITGWTKHGDRPEFTIVTGISAGALIAPFAFLGPDYDDELEQVFTRYATEDLLERRSLLRILLGDAVLDTGRLFRLIGQYLDHAAIDKIAEEYRRGRSLWIGTTNLDTSRPVFWDVTRIAASDTPDRDRLIHKILLASASIPGAFPPVYFDVEVDGQSRDELHVDGGITSPVFLYPEALDFRDFIDARDVKGTPDVYVIANLPLVPNVDPVEPPNLLQISSRSILSLIRTQSVGAVYAIYLGTQRDGLGFNLAYIPPDFALRPTEPFDLHFMQALFTRGFDAGREGYAWARSPVALDRTGTGGVEPPGSLTPMARILGSTP